MFRITSNLDDFQRRLQQIKENVEALSGPRQIPLNELFNTSFMSRYTSFGTFDEMLQSSGVQIQTSADLDQNDAWDNFVAAHTQFSSWQKMLRAAGEEYYTKELKKAFGS